MRFVKLLVLTLLPLCSMYVFASTTGAILVGGVEQLHELYEGKNETGQTEGSESATVDTFVFEEPTPSPEETDPTPPPLDNEPVIAPTPTLDPTHAHCVGPDGKTFHATQEACDKLISDWDKIEARDKKQAEEEKNKKEERKDDDDDDKRRYRRFRWGWGQ